MLDSEVPIQRCESHYKIEFQLRSFPYFSQFLSHITHRTGLISKSTVLNDSVRAAHNPYTPVAFHEGFYLPVLF